jgi:hypothetical protein
MKRYIVFLLLIIHSSSACNTKIEKDRKYIFNYDENSNSIHIFSKNGNRIIYLQFDDYDSIESVHIEDNDGFSIALGKDENKTLQFYNIIDPRYNCLTKISSEENIFVERIEQFTNISTNYKLFNNGQVDIKYWDIDNNAWERMGARHEL